MSKQSRIQKNFKKQMERAEKDMNRKAKKGEGVLANKLFRLRFYGYYDKETKKKSNPILRLFKGIIYLLAILVTLCIFIGGLFLILALFGF
jgi:hypothetical protein